MKYRLVGARIVDQANYNFITQSAFFQRTQITPPVTLKMPPKKILLNHALALVRTDVMIDNFFDC